jgi:hypothetical protein
MPTGTLVRFGVYLTRERRKQLLLTAIEEEISATKLVARLIADYLDRCPQPKTALEEAREAPKAESHDKEQIPKDTPLGI